MNTPSIDALVSSRICHDLISPVGAIGNGIELLEVMASTTPEVGLISQSVASARAKLQFFRICFGQSFDGAVLGIPEVEKTAAAMLESKRVTLAWQGLPEATPRIEIKLVFLLLLCVETALPLGGDLRVANAGGVWTITANAPRVQVGDAWKILEWQMPAEPVKPALVQFPLARDLARDLGRTVDMQAEESGLRVTL